jgi:hypothetical protein
MDAESADELKTVSTKFSADFFSRMISRQELSRMLSKLGVNVMITIFSIFANFLRKILALFRVKNNNFFADFFGELIKKSSQKRDSRTQMYPEVSFKLSFKHFFRAQASE